MPATTSASESSRNAVLESVPTTLPLHFQQAQHSLANHRKNIVSLYRLHLACSAFSEQTSKGTRMVGEKVFNEAFISCLNRVLNLKKGVSNADRVIKFTAAYSKYTQDQFRLKARQARKGQEEEDEEDDEDEEEDTPATRFVVILLKHLMRGFGAKDKNVRLRCCQAVALLISGLESIDDELFEALRKAYLTRASDKESSVRVQAIVALAKLQSGEDDEADESMDTDDESKLTTTDILIRLLRHDPSAEVRRAALFNLSPTEETLPFILERLHDVDTINRRCLYLGSFSNAAIDAPNSQIKMTPEMWSTVVKTGLGERENSVARATKKLIASWIDVEGDKGEAERFLRRFDVLESPEAAAMALEAAFEVRPALLDKVSFDDDFWQVLTPEKAFVARTFAKYCKSIGTVGERKMEESMPLVTALAFRTQAAWGKLVEQLELAQEGKTENSEAVIRANESVVQSLLHVSMNLDYGDEIGRRKMFGLVRELVSSALLPEHLINDCLDVLRKLSAGQKDFIRIIVEIAQEIEDIMESVEEQQDGDGSEDEIEGELLGQKRTTLIKKTEERMNEEETAQQATIDARRLIIVRGMLERVLGAMQENTAMHGLVSELIAPAVRSKDSIVREQGLICLGLCCLLDAQLAQQTFGLFLQQMEEATEQVRLASIRVVFDNLTSHGIAFLCKAQIQQRGGDGIAAGDVHTEMVNYLLGLLEDENLSVQAIAAEGMAKLMLSGMVEDDDALRSLVLVYMSPETSGNQELRQCLSYFLPVYCYSSSNCQRRLQRVIVPTLDVLTEVYAERDEDQEMVTPLQVGLQLLDWSDPTKALYSSKDVAIHLDVAVEFLQSLFIKQDKDERKVLCQLLGKLVIPEEEELHIPQQGTSGGAGAGDPGEEGAAANNGDNDFTLLAVLFALLGSIKKVHNVDRWDATSRNNLNRFQLNCKKKYPFAWEKCRVLDGRDGEELQGVRAFLQECGADPSRCLDMGDDGTIVAPLTARRRRSLTASRSISSSTTIRKASNGSGTSGGRVSRKVSLVGSLTLDSDEEEEEEEEERHSRHPSSAAAIKEEDEEDVEEDDSFDTI
ncbi:hypothetical protein CBS101457_004129 [Exobasidium rhododendri]|nr:hypothetical protein CBS101457_004129 [Exobasidium rhododendri]